MIRSLPILLLSVFCATAKGQPASDRLSNRVSEDMPIKLPASLPVSLAVGAKLDAVMNAPGSRDSIEEEYADSLITYYRIRQPRSEIGHCSITFTAAAGEVQSIGFVHTGMTRSTFEQTWQNCMREFSRADAVIELDMIQATIGGRNLLIAFDRDSRSISYRITKSQH